MYRKVFLSPLLWSVVVAGASFLYSCSALSGQNSGQESVEGTKIEKIVHIKVMRDGTIFFEDQKISVDLAEQKVLEMSGTATGIYYYREALQVEEEPHPNALRIIGAVMKAKTPFQMSCKPDFSEYVDAEGICQPNPEGNGSIPFWTPPPE
jgi:hypothetical protein